MWVGRTVLLDAASPTKHPSNTPKSRKRPGTRRCLEAHRPSPRSGAHGAQLQTATADTGRGGQTAGAVTRHPRISQQEVRTRWPQPGFRLLSTVSLSRGKAGKGNLHTPSPLLPQLPQAQTSKLSVFIFQTNHIHSQPATAASGAEWTDSANKRPSCFCLSPTPSCHAPGSPARAQCTLVGEWGWGVQTGKYTGWR